MAIQFVEPTSAVRASYAAGLSDLTGSPPPDDRAIHVPVWTLDLESVARGEGPGSEQAAGCRFYASYPPPLGVVSSEMTNPSDYGKAKFRSLLDGELAQWGWTRMQQIAALPQVAAAHYELHLLSIPSLFAEAFMLRPTDGSDRVLVVPVDLFAEALAPPVTQTLTAYLIALEPMARERLAAANDPLLP